MMTWPDSSLELSVITGCLWLVTGMVPRGWRTDFLNGCQAGFTQLLEATWSAGRLSPHGDPHPISSQ